MGLAIKMEVWDSVEDKDKTVKYISPRLMKLRLQMGRTCGVAFVLGTHRRKPPEARQVSAATTVARICSGAPCMRRFERCLAATTS